MDQTIDIARKWETKLSTIDGQLCNMWNFILYNQFVDKDHKIGFVNFRAEV
jgi:hypothetical protein